MKSFKNVIILFIFSLCIGCNSTNEGSIIEEQNGIYSLLYGKLSLSISPEKGARMISLKQGDKELLSSEAVNNEYYGATLWISPQSVYWPQYPNIDQQPYKTQINGNKLSLTSQTDSINGILITKEFSISDKDSAIVIKYIISNISDQPKKLSPWDVTRVHGGLSFFPVGEANEMNKSDVTGHYAKDGLVWYSFASPTNEKGQKLFSTAKGGWLAHYYQGLLFVKCFPDITPSETPPTQGEVEIYVSPKGEYLELENHGKYTELKPGENLVYKQKWFVKEAPDKEPNELLAIIENLNKNID